ncbi:hypothetical protein RHGRI_020688 [Rhododendron griersonianum]|uniref:Uncharacterized protein n=1 Tax=Rhododendron griersonianum TaxID=479676 RepID=A0AAV6JH96_9ERIC|nr:hypothetical protein RHGRI_020688 [Rhododendron griersonianum]
MSQQKLASNVVEKCLASGTPEERNIIVNEMLGPTNENEPFRSVNYAFYVLEKMETNRSVGDGLKEAGNENDNQTDPNGAYSTGWNAHRSLNLLKFSLNRPMMLPCVEEDGDEEMKIVDIHGKSCSLCDLLCV